MTTMPRIAVAQLGARKHYQEPILFHQWGFLSTLYTDLYAENNVLTRLARRPSIYRLLAPSARKLLDRYSHDLDRARIVQFPWLGFRYAQAARRGRGQEARLFLWANSEFCRAVLRSGWWDADTVYGFNGASLELFQFAKAKGLRCVLDQVLADWATVHRELLEEEQRWPGWSTVAYRVTDDDIALLRREHEEQALADHIVCGSDYVRDSLVTAGNPPDKLAVVALGRLKDGGARTRATARTPRSNRRDPLRILFAGAVGLRKGVPYLLHALRLLQGEIPFTCKLAGRIELDHRIIDAYSNVCDFVSQVSRSGIAELFAWTDVVVLPSVCEGSAMVAYEALHYGLPVITTPNTGSIVRDGVDGFIVPTRDAAAIAEKLALLYRSGMPGASAPDTGAYLKQTFEAARAALYRAVAPDRCPVAGQFEMSAR